jgi:hypothetical protein
MNQILEAMQTTMTLQIETADSLVSLVVRPPVWASAAC